MSFTLRPYQQESVDAIFREFQTVNSTLLVLATGLGKTCVFSEIASRWDSGRVMVIAHRQELISQAAKKLLDVTGEMPAIEQGDQISNESSWGRSHFVVASKDSLHERRLARFSDIGLLIIDEAHRAAKKNKTYWRVIEGLRAKNPNLKILGVTATPKRHDKSALGQVFDSCAYQYEIEPAIENSWLVPVMPCIAQINSLDLSAVRVIKGDLDRKGLDEVLELEKVVQGMADVIVSESADRKCVMVFTSSVKQAKELARVLNFHEPDSAVWLCGDKKECPDHIRKTQIRRYAHGEFKYMLNCGLFLEGFDEPKIDLVAMCRPTKSGGLYKQMLGRGTRTYPGCIDGIETVEGRREAIANSLKPNVLVLDFVDNSRKHKLFSSVDVLGGKLDEETRALAAAAIEKASAKGERLTMDEAVIEASAEQEAKRKAAEEERERKRAAVIAKANYKKELVNPFDYADSAPGERKIRKTVMPFGKHKGEPIEQLHAGYIKVFLEKVPPSRSSQWVHNALRAELDRRGLEAPKPSASSSGKQPERQQINPAMSQTMATDSQKRVLAKYGKPTNVTAAEACRYIMEINAYLKDSAAVGV